MASVGEGHLSAGGKGGIFLFQGPKKWKFLRSLRSSLQFEGKLLLALTKSQAEGLKFTKKSFEGCAIWSKRERD